MPPSGIEPQPRVLLVSLDGAKPSVLRKLLDAGELPHLKSLMGGGSWTLDARVVGPTLTLPSHVTMVTGLPASRHGITWNKTRPELGAVEAETLFDLARRSGIRSAMVYGKGKFVHFVRPGAPDIAILEQGSAGAVAKHGAAFLRDPSYILVMVHFAQGDAAGHDFGWGDDAKGVPPSKKYLGALRRCDAAIGTLVRACRETGWERALVLVTADHGGRGDNHGTDDPQDVLVPWIAGGGLAEPLGELKMEVRSTDTAPTVLEALNLPVPATMEGRPVDCLRAPLRKAA